MALDVRRQLDQVAARLKTEPVVFPAEFRKSLPADLRKLVGGAIALQKADRYGTVKLFADDLWNWLARRAGPAGLRNTRKVLIMLDVRSRKAARQHFRINVMPGRDAEAARGKLIQAGLQWKLRER